MLTNYEKIKTLTIDEMAEFTFVTFWAENAEKTRREKFMLAYDGSFHKSLKDLIEANKKWLKSTKAPLSPVIEVRGE